MGKVGSCGSRGCFCGHNCKGVCKEDSGALEKYYKVVEGMTPNRVVSLPSHQPPRVPSSVLISYLSYYLFAFGSG